MKLSATVITLNEQDELGRCLKSLEGLVDEIVLVDSGSIDETLKIAKAFKAKVFHHDFINYELQKNFALSKCKGEWVLSIDADEVIPSELAREIKEVIKNDKFDGYLIPRRNIILGKEIKYSRWSPDKHIWLWKKDHGSWVGDVHEEVVIDGQISELKNAKIHYQEKTIAEFVEKNNKYSSLEAGRMYMSGARFSWWRMNYDATREFLLRFVYKKGFLDGWRGLVLAYLMGMYKRLIWLKVLELQKSGIR